MKTFLTLLTLICLMTSCKKQKQIEPTPTTQTQPTHLLTVQFKSSYCDNKQVWLNDVQLVGDVSNLTVHSGDKVRFACGNNSGHPFGSTSYNSVIGADVFVDGTNKYNTGCYCASVDNTYTIE